MDVFWPITVLESGLTSLIAPRGTSSLHSPCRARMLPLLPRRWHCAGPLMGRTCSSRVWHPVWSRSGKSTHPCGEGELGGCGSLDTPWWEGTCLQTRKSKGQGKSRLASGIGDISLLQENNALGLACLLGSNTGRKRPP